MVKRHQGLAVGIRIASLTTAPLFLRVVVAPSCDPTAVEAEFTNKYQIRVQAPAEKGSHDDMADVAAGVAMLAAEWLNDEKHLLLDPSGSSLLANERVGMPPAVMPNLDALSLSDIKTLSRQQKLQKNLGIPGFAAVKNPFHKRGRR